MIENNLQKTLRAIAACGEVLIAISDAEPNDEWGKESPFNQRCLAGLSLAVQLLADSAYSESVEPIGEQREIELTLDRESLNRLDYCAEQQGVSREEMVSRLIVEENLRLKIFESSSEPRPAPVAGFFMGADNKKPAGGITAGLGYF